MRWLNLKENKCPKCGKSLGYSNINIVKPKEIFLTCNCGFKIGEKRASEIVNSQVTQELNDKWDQEYDK